MEVLLALNTVIDHLSEISQKQDLILEQYETLNTQFTELGNQIDEQVLVDFRKGMRCLIAAHNSDLETVRIKEYDRARDIFSMLISLDPKGTTEGTSGEIENPYLISIGYWGSFQYFNLLGDYRNALIHAYECTMLYPEIAVLGLNLFPSSAFSKNFAALWRKAVMQLGELTERNETHKSKNQNEKLSFYAKQALRVGATGVVGAASAGVSVVAGALANIFGAGPAVYWGVKATKGTWDALKVEKADTNDIEAIELQIEQVTTTIHDLREELIEECQTRKTELQRTSLKELQRIRDLQALEDESPN